MKKKFDNIFLNSSYQNKLQYKSRRRATSNFVSPQRNRYNHGIRLKNLYINSIENSDNGVYIDFFSHEGFDLKLESLESVSKEIRLINVKYLDDNKTKATVYIPSDKTDIILKKIEEYAEKDTKKGKPKNEPLIANIEDIHKATAESLWNGSQESLPSETQVWCEIWLMNNDDDHQESVLKKFYDMCQELNIEINEGSELEFPERIVKLAKINLSNIIELIDKTNFLAEIRPSVDLPTSWIDMDIVEQHEWSEELLDRILIDRESNISVCILDTGVNNGHPLLSNLLKDTDKHAVDPSWGVDDHDGHGTSMSGIAAYQCLSNVFSLVSTLNINHTLSSVKILPKYSTRPELWGSITEQAVYIREIAEPNKNHIYCMAITYPDETDEYHSGQPSSWSSSIDKLLFDNFNNSNKLFVVSAGNIDSNYLKVYPNGNYTSGIHDPGQSWNAVVVGAYTEKTTVNDPEGYLSNYKNIAQSGELSPFTTTSIIWKNQWPIKPDIVFEGGNALIDSSNFTTIHDDLSLLTTNWQPMNGLYTTINATSAATALASSFLAKLYSKFPKASPETIRGLMVHSANWTEAMYHQHIPNGKVKKEDYRALLRACGYGIPNLDKAINCYTNSLTMISENSIVPYQKEKNNIKFGEMDFYELPWPKDVLLDLSDTDVEMRVTLSYFIEPSPSELDNININRYQYQSHGLRFDINHPLESKDEFIERKNKHGSNEDYVNSGLSSRGNWLLGTTQRDRGSVISDIWAGKASELATCNFLCVYPVTGWWKTRKNLNRYSKSVSYSIIISIYSPREDIDIYTSVHTQINIPIEINV